MSAGSEIVTNEFQDGLHQLSPLLPDFPVQLGVIHAISIGEPLFRRALAAKIYRMRRDRSQLFPIDLFGEPAWDVLLLLYGIEHRSEHLSVSAVCASAGAPPTTTLRWIEKLEQERLLIREPHPSDRRITLVRMSGRCQQLMDRYFDRALGSQIGVEHAPGR